jgi:hypothetical protein
MKRKPRKPRKAALIATSLLTAVLIAAWVHSHVAGWRSESSNSDAMTANRLVSANGQVYYQSCNLKPSGLSAVLTGEQRAPATMPDGFTVGSNPNGPQTVIKIANFSVAFTDPHPRQFISLHNQETNRNSEEDGFWYANTRELLIAYWLATLIPGVILLSECRKWYLFKRTDGRGNEEKA